MHSKQNFYRLDEQVFFAMGGMCLLALITLAFQYSMKEACLPVKIFLSDSLITDNVILFRADMPGGTRFSWDFGDGATKEEQSNNTTHIFKTPGQYTVNVLVNGSCDGTQTIFVKEAPIITSTSMMPRIFSSSDTAYLGDPMTFTDLSPTSTSWEWRFGSTNTVDATTQDATTTFNRAGVTRIILTVNGRPDLRTYKEILVIDREAEKERTNKPKKYDYKPIPPPPIIKDNPVVEPIVNPTPPEEPEKPKAPAITRGQLESMLIGIASGEKTEKDFEPYFCGNTANVKIVYEKKIITFSSLYKEIKGIKRKKIKSVTAIPTIDKTTNCILQIAVDIDKKNILGF